MIDPTPLYEASGNSPGIVDSAVSLGEFVYVNQGFRYLDRQVFLGFTTDGPMRITIAGAAQAKKLIHKVEPIYPPKAAAEHIEGTVKFFVVLGRDGSVEQISVTSGNPALLQSAIDAVKQWRYRPTVVGGIPFHVATDVEVDFHLNK
jgi:TonB family protein